MEVANKIVVVSGASSGVGEAIAKAMSKAGAGIVVLLARNESSLARVANEIEVGNGKARYYVVDLSQPEEISNVARRILNEVGVPDILINNAGSGQWKYLEDTSVEEIRQMIAVPYFSAAWLTRAFLPDMLKRNSGHIVNISSLASRVVWPGATAYTAARWAVRGLTEALRADLYGTGIGVTLYESGEIETPYWQHNPGSRERIPKIGKMIPVLSADQVGQAIVDGVRRNKSLIVIPFIMRLMYLVHFLFPWLVQWLMRSTGYHRRR
jgi:short-subunit dehydrogenase